MALKNKVALKRKTEAILISDLTKIMSNPGPSSARDAEFKVPVMKRRKKTYITQPIQKASSVGDLHTANVYESLNNNQNTDDYDMSSEGSHRSRRNNKQYRPPLHSNRTPAGTSATKGKPIVVYSVKNEEIHRIISSVTLKTPVTFAKGSSYGQTNFRIFTSSSEDKKAIVEHLKAKQYSFHTFSKREERHTIFILKNFNYMEPAELLELIKQSGVNAVSVGFARKHEQHPSYHVHFERSSITLKELNESHNVIASQRIIWDKTNSTPKRLTQCTRCQTWGHSARNCNHAYKCVKCIEHHEPGQCKRKDPNVGQPTCSNCKKEGHPANSTVCEYFVKHRDFVNSRKSQKPMPNNNRGYIHHDRDFPTETAGPSATHYQPGPSVRNIYQPGPSAEINHLNAQNCKSSRPTYASVTANFTNGQSSEPNSQSFFDLNQEFWSIPGLNEALGIYRDFVEQLKAAAGNPHKMFQIMVQFRVQPCP